MIMRVSPCQSWQFIRNYCEKFRWIDPHTGQKTTGYTPPSGVKFEQVPFFIRFVTGKGKLEQGEVINLKIDRRRHQRKVKFIASNEIRIVRDYLVISIDGMRFI